VVYTQVCIWWYTLGGVYPGVYLPLCLPTTLVVYLPLCLPTTLVVYLPGVHTLLHYPGYTPYTAGPLHRRQHARPYVTLRREEALGSEKEKPVGMRGKEAPGTLRV